MIWGKSKTLTDVVTVLGMQLYYDIPSDSTGVKLLISVGSQLYLISDFINDWRDGWKKNAMRPLVQTLNIEGTSQNPLF